MLEIVFNESAAGSLKVGQHYGKGKYPARAASVFLLKRNGTEPTEEEKKAALREVKEKDRLAWEAAVPLGGNASDVFCFAQGLSIGDISEDCPGEKRKQLYSMLYSMYPQEHVTEIMNQALDRCKINLNLIYKRSAEQEPMRIWYSDQPDELCGMYWLMWQIGKWDVYGPIYVVKLPCWEEGDKGEIIQKSGWGELSAEEWSRYVPLQRKIKQNFIMSCADQWETLQKENAPLRVMLNGRLVSMPEDIYDSFIEREISLEEDVFSEASLIGKLLGKYRLGVSDAWFSLRIEEMIKNRKLSIEQEASGLDCLDCMGK